jgi:hypothetical protein
VTRPFRLSLRLGGSLPVGSSVSQYPLNRTDQFRVPIWLDVGYQATQKAFVGAYAQYGIISVKGGETCTSEAGGSCSAHDIQAGVEGLYSLAPNAGVNPWFGLGIGVEFRYDALTYTSGAHDKGRQDAKAVTTGAQFLNFQFGVDFPLSDAFALGPFLSASVSEYSHQTWETTDEFHSEAITETAFHGWLTLGVKGSLGL